MTYLAHKELTHLPLVPHICINELGHHWVMIFFQVIACRLFDAQPLPEKKWWRIVNWARRNNPQRTLNQNTKVSFMKMHLEMSVYLHMHANTAAHPCHSGFMKSSDRTTTSWWLLVPRRQIKALYFIQNHNVGASLEYNAIPICFHDTYGIRIIIQIVLNGGRQHVSLFIIYGFTFPKWQHFGSEVEEVKR